MSPSVDDVINCLQKYDKVHQDFYQRHAEVLASKLYVAFQNITNVACTEDPNISGTDYRVDAYVETPTEMYPPSGEVLYEFRRDAGNCSRKPNAQTRHPTGGAHIPPTTSLHGRKTAEGLHRTEIYRRTVQSDLVLAPRLRQVTLVLNKYSTPRPLHSYGVKKSRSLQYDA
jgi:hypothetical protein